MTERNEWRRGRCHELWAEQQGRCFYCDAPMADPLTQRQRHRKRPDSATIDHVVPRTMGGAEAWPNEVAACRACNAAKADTPPSDAELEKLRRQKTELIAQPAAAAPGGPDRT